MPDVGEGIAEAELVEWHVKVGDLVREDAVLAAVMTDKATVEIPRRSMAKCSGSGRISATWWRRLASDPPQGGGEGTVAPMGQTEKAAEAPARAPRPSRRPPSPRRRSGS